RKNRRRAALRIEELESRTLMSAVTALPIHMPPVILPGTFGDNNFAAPALAAHAYKYNPTGTAWAFSPTSGVAGNGSGFTSGNPVAPDGTQVGFLQKTGSISQSVYLTPGSYSISFLAAQRQNVQAHFQALNVLVD